MSDLENKIFSLVKEALKELEIPVYGEKPKNETFVPFAVVNISEFRKKALQFKQTFYLTSIVIYKKDMSDEFWKDVKSKLTLKLETQTTEFVYPPKNGEFQESNAICGIGNSFLFVSFELRPKDQGKVEIID